MEVIQRDKLTRGSISTHFLNFALPPSCVSFIHGHFLQDTRWIHLLRGPQFVSRENRGFNILSIKKQELPRIILMKQIFSVTTPELITVRTGLPPLVGIVQMLIRQLQCLSLSSIILAGDIDNQLDPLIHNSTELKKHIYKNLFFMEVTYTLGRIEVNPLPLRSGLQIPARQVDETSVLPSCYCDFNNLKKHQPYQSFYHHINVRKYVGKLFNVWEHRFLKIKY